MLVLFVIILAVSGYFFMNAKKIIMAKMEASLGVPVNVTEFKISWPLSVTLEGLSIGKDINVERLEVVPGLTGMLSGGLVFNSILVDRPFIKASRLPDKPFDVGLPEKKEKSKVAFVMRRLVIKDGKVEFSDHMLSEPFSVTVDSINADVKQASMTRLTKIDFDISGRVAGAKGENAGDLKMEGWIDWPAKDTEGSLTVSGASLLPFGPYYRQYMKKDLQSGSGSARADFKSDNNDLSVNCHLELANVVFRVKSDGEQQDGSMPDFNDMTSLALNSMFSTEGGAIFDFSIRTKLDQPKFENLKIKGSFLQNKIQSVIQNPEKAAEQYEDIGKQFKDIGKQFKDIFK